MQAEELKQALVQLGFDPKNSPKPAMQDFLIQRLLSTTASVSAPAASPKASAESAGVPAFIAQLAPELQLQWYLRQEERATILAKAQTETAAAAAAAAATTERLKLENAARAEAAAAAARIEKEKRDAAAAAAKLEADMKAADLEAKRAHEAEMRAADREHELALKQLELQTPHAPTPVAFRLEQAIKLLPRFNERNVEEYLISFEKIASINEWPQDRYASILQAMLVGKGLRVFSELAIEDCQNYDKLRAALLNAYSVVSEVHRTRFRGAVKQPSETFSDFAFTLGIHFKRWVEGENAYDNLDRLREVVKLEQFGERLHPELRTWLAEKVPQTLVEAAKLADEYTALRKANPRYSQQPFYSRPKQNQNGGPRPYGNPAAFDFGKSEAGGNKTTPPGEGPPSKLPNKFASVFCHYCHKRGHVRANCFLRQQAETRKTDPQTRRPEPGAVQFVSRANKDTADVSADLKTPQLGFPVDPLFNTHWCTATVTRRDGSNSDMCMLRDSGSLQSLLSRDKVNDNDFIDTGEYRLIRGLGGTVIRVPLVEVTMESKYGKGTFLFGLVDCLPDPVFHGLIGNDLDPPPALFDEILAVNAVTRLQSKVRQQQQQVGICPSKNDTVSLAQQADVQSTLVANSDDSDPLATNVSSLFVEASPSTVNISLSAVTSPEDLVKLQHNDNTLTSLFQLVQPRTTDLNGQPQFYLDQQVLMRAWRAPDAPNIAGTELTQVVVPVALRTAILQLAHDIPAAAHLGMAKTKKRLEQHFYWPSMAQDVKLYVRTCDVCQRLGKGGKPPSAPLYNLPAISEPFRRLAMDIVGPLPTCRDTGNRFILTVIDHCTHFPEAVPLVTHEASDVAKALVSIFSRYGFPAEILSDCGSEFMSKLMAVFLKEFGISRIRTSPYHPATNGSCERFNGTLKSMIRAVCDDYPDTWDQTLPWVLFAYREVPVETLGFSPFELVYAHAVMGPLALVKDSWLRSSKHVASPIKSVVAFVLDMRERLRTAIQQAVAQASDRKQKSKVWYDRKARDRTFQPNEEVLALLPLHGNPLQAKYCGPYRILEKLGPVDYLIDTPNRRKNKRVCHVNLLKPYRRRDEKFFPKLTENAAPVCIAEVDHPSSEFGTSIPALEDLRQLDSDPPKPSGLSVNQQKQLTSLLSSFADIFKDTPGQTSMITHHIELTPGCKPITSSPYRLHPEKAALVEKEITEMLKLGIVEQSDSPWASPIVLVPKPDGSTRLCVDYRRVNALTVPDPFPFPRIEDLVDKVGRAKFLTKVDMTRGYWQVPLDEYSGPISAFVTATGHFQWRFLPFGLRNAPATFSRLVSKLLKGLECFAGAYLDDVIVFSDTWEEHLQHLSEVFSRIRKAGLTLNKKKCEFACAELDYLGHHVGRGKVEPRRQKVEALVSFPRPTSRKQVQSFLGLGGYYRRYIPHFASLSACLSDLLKKGTKFEWDEKAEQAFLDIKSRLASQPVLIAPNFDKPFIIGVDASDKAIGAVLMQESDGLERPVCYLSRKLNSHQKRYAIVEKEAFALLTAVRAFSIYFGSAPTVVYTDHSPLQFMNKMAPHNQKLLRWALELQQYNLDVRHRAGRDNLLPDILSRPSDQDTTCNNTS